MDRIKNFFDKKKLGHEFSRPDSGSGSKLKDGSIAGKSSRKGQISTSSATSPSSSKELIPTDARKELARLVVAEAAQRRSNEVQQQNQRATLKMISYKSHPKELEDLKEFEGSFSSMLPEITSANEFNYKENEYDRSSLKLLTRYQDYVRVQREKRNQSGWDFFKFFILQEELAFAFEQLSMYEDALIQYDELNALFSQFVINSHAVQPPDWLKPLVQRCHFWKGLALSKTVQAELREKIKDSNVSLLDFRNYLFSRQCDLLFVQDKPSDLFSRALPFLLDCVNEIKILEVNYPSGAVACWAYLSALEILTKCERYNDSSQMQFYSKYTVGLWVYAQKKLKELGDLCGLMPPMKHDSENIHKVVSLIFGMGEDPYPDCPTSPQVKLKEALSKPESFFKAYLEISELAISACKHIGRFRCGRLIGRELALLYMRMSLPQQSIPFFLDHEKIFLKEKWFEPLKDTRKNLLECYTALRDQKKVLNYLLLLAACNTLPSDLRHQYLDQAKELSKTLNEDCSFSTDELISVGPFSLKSQDIISINSTLELTIHLNNYFLEPISLRFAKVFLSRSSSSSQSKTELPNNQSCQSNHCPHQIEGMPRNIDIQPFFETYHIPEGVGVKCPNVNQYFRKIDESFKQLDQSMNSVDDSSYFYADNIELVPGLNKLTLTFQVSEYGCYAADKVQLNLLSNISLLKKSLENHLCFSVISRDSSLQDSSSITTPAPANSEVAVTQPDGQPTKMRFIRLDKPSLLN